jgi:PAS domain S-box-containing protein
MAEIRHVTQADRLEPVLQQVGPTLLIMDLRANECRNLIEQIQKKSPEVLIVALGIPRSDPFRVAEQFGIYAVEDLELDRQRFQALVKRALDHLKILEENRDLREPPTTAPVGQPSPRSKSTAEQYGAPSVRLLKLPRVLRRFENVDALLASIVEEVAEAAGVTRVGIFARVREGQRYRLRAGLWCLPETNELEFGERDALVRWFELHAHLISRANLAQTPGHEQRLLMRRSLDAFGAEAIGPLRAHNRVIGWLFFGHRLTGQPFNNRDVKRLMIMAKQVSTLLEDALLNKEVALQKTLAEALLESIPTGIIAVDEEAIVRWFNPTAEQILGLPSSEVLGKPVEAAGTRLAALLRETLKAETSLPPQQWIDDNTRRSLSVEARKLVAQGGTLGAVAVINDLTA